MNRTTLLSTILLCLSVTVTYSQNREDLALMQDLLQPEPAVDYTVELGDEGELKKALKLLFNGYKRYISSQDVQSCNFSPSCSVYGLHAVEVKGVFWGIFATIDRLTRCHPLGGKHYSIDPETGLWYDPPTP